MDGGNTIKEIYFDNNATTKPLPEVRDKVLEVLGDNFGNPSSLHSTGERARNYLNNARESVSRLVGSQKPSNIIFTSSGTEANNLALYSCIKEHRDHCRIITTRIEHSSIRKMCSFLEINDVDIYYLSVDALGRIRLEELEKALETQTDLVSIQWVNNETGVVQDMERILDICKSKDVLFHTDAAQALGKIKFRVEDLPIDFLTFAGHKFHSPQGCGGIYARDKFRLHPILFGGFQEEGFRPGTENLPGIVGMGKAAEIRIDNIDKVIHDLSELRDGFESKILDFIPGSKINGDSVNRVCNTTNIMLGRIDGRKLVKMLDERGMRCSQSSACTNFDPSPSYVLKALGLDDDQAYSSIRFSFGVENTIDEIEDAVNIVRECVDELNSENDSNS